MAIRIVINISKKQLGLTDYSSIQASCSIEREIAHGEDILTAAADLQAQAEAAVDQQLARGSAPTPPPSQLVTGRPGQTANTPARAATPPPRPSGHGRRAPTRATPSQLGLLQRLIGDNQSQVIAICQHHQVQELAALTVAQASEVIDTLKAPR